MPSERSYPPSIEVRQLVHRPRAMISAPGSKSITNRALVLAALSYRCSVIGALHSDDVEVMVDCLRRLGFEVHADWDKALVEVARPRGVDRPIPSDQADLFVGNSGTTMRFLTALVSLGHGTYRLDGVPRMRERPIQDLLDALRRLDVDARSEAGNGCPPVIVEADGLHGGRTKIRGDVSSQFLSALLMVAPFATSSTIIEVTSELVSQPYVEMTARMMSRVGLTMERSSEGEIVVPGRQRTSHHEIIVEPDASSASYFFAAAAITGGSVTVADLGRDSLQGDVAFVDVLHAMGCRVEECSHGITVHGRPLRGIEVSMAAISDTAMTLGAVACFAEGPTTIRDVGHIRHKETDRIAAMATELRKVGAEVKEFADGLTITPRPLNGAMIETYNDHRMAMSMALIGLKVPGVTVLNPGCVAKTYPGFWDDLERLRDPR
jgi:3-phosphoshikimate 1-carboxyvinyltransferase